jgi:uncharacterized protein (DUF427 family)
LEPVSKHIRVILNGAVVAETRKAIRVLETSHPPTYYIPLKDVRTEFLVSEPGTSVCEWKGRARYYSVTVGDRRAGGAAWAYPQPTEPFAVIADHVAFYAGSMDSCTVDGEEARPQPGGFYGGWITDDIVGPFKGEPGTSGW